jgi:hypothetical protein
MGFGKPAGSPFDMLHSLKTIINSQLELTSENLVFMLFSLELTQLT